MSQSQQPKSIYHIRSSILSRSITTRYITPSWSPGRQPPQKWMNRRSHHARSMQPPKIPTQTDAAKNPDSPQTFISTSKGVNMKRVHKLEMIRQKIIDIDKPWSRQLIWCGSIKWRWRFRYAPSDDFWHEKMVEWPIWREEWQPFTVTHCPSSLQSWFHIPRLEALQGCCH